MNIDQQEEQFQKFNAINVNNNSNQWHLKDELIPQNVIDEFPQFPVVVDYAALMAEIESVAADLGE